MIKFKLKKIKMFKLVKQNNNQQKIIIKIKKLNKIYQIK